MKERMCRQMSCCCQMMMAKTMKGSVYIIGINKTKTKQYEKSSINNCSINEYQHQPYLG